MLLVLASGEYQIILLTPCTVIARSPDLDSLDELWQRVKDFLDTLPSSTLENPPNLFKAYKSFYNILQEDFPSTKGITVERSPPDPSPDPKEMPETKETTEENENETNHQQIDINAIIDHIFNQPSLEGIAPLVSSLPTVLRQHLLWERSNSRETILHMATQKNSTECVRVFLEIGIDINAKDKNGWTALHCACYEGFTEICSFLLKKGANVLPLTHSRTTPLHYLVRSVTDENWPEHSRTIEALISEGVDINAKDSHGKTPLHHVLLRGRNQNCVEYLLSRSASVNVQSEGEMMTPIHIAAIYGNTALIRCLLDARGDPLIKSQMGTALDIATEHKHKESQKLLNDFIHGRRKRSISKNLQNSSNSIISASSSHPKLLERATSERTVSTSAPKSSLSGSQPEPLTSVARQARRSRVGSFSSLASAVDRKRQSFGIDNDAQRHLETYTCKLNKQHGVLYVYQRYFAFETMLNQKIVISFKDVISMKRYIIITGLELVVRDKNGRRKDLVFSSLLVPDEELYNVFDFLISVRHKPDPVCIDGVPLHQMLGAVKYPEVTKEFLQRFKNHKDPSDILIQAFIISACVLGNNKISSGHGSLYLTHKRLGYYNNTSGKRTILLMRLNRIISMAARGQGIEIFHKGKQAKEIWYFSFPSKEIQSRAYAIIERQWQVELQNTVVSVVGILGVNTFLGQEIARHYILQDMKFRPILIDSLAELDNTLAPVSKTSTSILDSAHMEIYRVDFNRTDNQEQLQHALAGVSKLFFVVNFRDCLQNVKSIIQCIQENPTTIQHIIMISMDFCELYEDSFHTQLAESEKLIKSTRVPYTILRIGMPMQFLPTCVLPSSKLVAFPLLEGKLNWIDLYDVCQVVLTVLLDESSQYDFTTYRLTTDNSHSVFELQSILQSHVDPKYNVITDIDQCLMMLEYSLIPDDQIPVVLELLQNIQTQSSQCFSCSLQEDFHILSKPLVAFVTEHKELFEAPCRMYFNDKEKQIHLQSFQSLCITSGKETITYDDFTTPSTSYLTSSGLFYAVFRAFDATRSKELDAAQYLHGLSILLYGSEGEQLDFSFRMFDGGEKGYLSPHAFSAITDALRFLLPNDTEQVFQFSRSLTSLMDPNKTGQVSYANYKHACIHNRKFITSLGRESGRETTNKLNENFGPPVPPKGFPIDFHHEQWDLVWHIMCGITQSVRNAEEQIFRGDAESFFGTQERYSFPSATSKDSNAITTSWSFIDIAPVIFRMIRERFHVSSAEYLSAVGTEYFLGNLILGNLRTLRTMSSTGRSGSIFFVSADNRFFIKTIPDEEDTTFCRILQDYYDHIKENPNTLVTRFYGLHRIREGNGPWMSFVVMENLFRDTPLNIHEIYDLKGSTVNRHVKVKEGDKSSVALKDNNFHHALLVGDAARAIFFQQLEQDVRWMENRNICDYSLLVGIHFRSEGKILSDSHWESEASLDEFVSALEEDATAEDTQNLFKRFHNGILSADKTAVYFIGIIDTLTEYNLKKRGEHFAKSILHGPSLISAVPPSQYRRRYQKYVISIVK